MWNMPSNFIQRQLVFFGLALLFLLFWSAYDYGGRYLQLEKMKMQTLLYSLLMVFLSGCSIGQDKFGKTKTIPLSDYTQSFVSIDSSNMRFSLVAWQSLKPYLVTRILMIH